MHGGVVLMLSAIIGISGPVLTQDERDLFARHAPRGVILFGRNIENSGQLAGLVGELRKVLAPGAVLMVDQEGGRVARLRAPFWPDLPAAGTLTTEDAAFAHGRALGAMCRAAGFDVAAAPVLDLRYEGADAVIGDRAISGDPQIVARLGGRIAAGILAAGVTPVMKHLPGHGRALVDSHKALPRVSDADLAADFYPFAANCGLPWGMTAHIVYEAIDPDHPATLSKIVIRDVIRGKIGFLGTLLSDDLAMGALSGTPAERALAALAAGCDIALYCPGDFAGNASVLRALADD
jgi:beta-N-acetylhexosaminidase